MILNEPYSKELFVAFLKDFLPDYQKDERQVRTPDKSILTEVTQLGLSRDVNVTVLEAECEETDTNKRIAITQAAFKVLRDHGIRNAIIAFHDGADQWRLSLLTSTLEIKDGKVIKKDSNPRRYSYLLGVGAKTVTPYKYLIEKGPVEDIKQLQERFSVEVVNKQFYSSIAELFTKLIGGKRGVTKYAGLLKLNGAVSQNVEHQEFAVRLIGRVIFSWFLKEKKSKAGVPIISNELLSLDAIASNADYYHSILEPLFFELLNKRVEQRHENLRETPFSTVPYLNGGLFSPQYNDYYNQSSYSGAGTPGLTHIPDNWFVELFTILEQYNFTVDENTSYDVDLSIDPEMLGRIFENLLAEINPETGESARKSTGSFYTPREIVDYMVDSTLLEFLKSKTGIDENKLKALISWGMADDEQYPLTDNEKEKAVSALSNLTILDPACGSGAFPIGILQKVVYILQRVDEKAELWLQNQLKSITSPELRRDIEEKYHNENYDYLRKLGVIRESIFGVDIQTVATEISKLRCFLTLIIEEDVDDAIQNRGIRPLPNLDFKFVTANSLIGLPSKSDGKNILSESQSALFEDTSHIDRLKEIRNRYFGADSDERNRLQIEFKDLQHTMLKSRLASMGATTDLYNVLSDWNPFNHEKTEWFDSEWMFGVDGFDIVIANPPYVGTGSRDSSGKMTSKEKNQYRELYPNSAEYKINLYALFMELGIRLCKQDGVTSYIVPDSFLLGMYFSKIRKYILDTCQIKQIVMLGSHVFAAHVGFSVVYVFQKTHNKQSDLVVIDAASKNGNVDISKHYSYSQNYFTKQNRSRFRIFFNKSDKDLVDKIELGSIPLGSHYTGRTGVRSKIGQKNIISKKKANPTYQRGIISGGQVNKNRVDYDDDWININPELLNAGGWDSSIISNPKLLVRQTADTLICALDTEGYYHLNNLHSFAPDDDVWDIYFIAGVFNSKLLRWYYEILANEKGRPMPQTDIETLEKLPIKYDVGIAHKISALVSSIYEGAEASDIEPRIDELVYSLYGLTTEEIAIVEAGA